jgi:UDP-N-acetylglucosamine:LPS N-acetylglucosamine transferase
LEPQRVLIVSANMGEGHNATGRALDQAARALWPAARIRWLDTLDVMGRGVGPVFREIYVTNVRRTPWLYEFFYTAIQRNRWFADASKRFVGAWCGRRLARHIDEYRPDVILCTYPLGSSGLARGCPTSRRTRSGSTGNST